MPAQTTEYAFETRVEEILIGPSGWRRGDVAEWDVEKALFPARICAFIAETQPKLWADMRTLHGAGLERLILDALVKELDLKGTLHVLRHGFKFFGRTFRLAYFKPAHGLNEEISGRPRPARAAVRFQEAGARPFCRRPRRNPCDDASP